MVFKHLHQKCLSSTSLDQSLPEQGCNTLSHVGDTERVQGLEKPSDWGPYMVFDVGAGEGVQTSSSPLQESTHKLRKDWSLMWVRLSSYGHEHALDTRCFRNFTAPQCLISFMFTAETQAGLSKLNNSIKEGFVLNVSADGVTRHVSNLNLRPFWTITSCSRLILNRFVRSLKSWRDWKTSDLPPRCQRLKVSPSPLAKNW